MPNKKPQSSDLHPILRKQMAWAIGSSHYQHSPQILKCKRLRYPL